MLLFYSFSYSQTAPIQNGSSNYNGDLTHSGDIGLGTSSPSARLHILRPAFGTTTGNVWSDDYLKIQYNKYNGWQNPPTVEPVFLINSNGDVGIATDSPLEKLHVNGNSLFAGNIKVGNNNWTS